MKILTFIALFIILNNEESCQEKFKDIQDFGLTELLPWIHLINSSMESVILVSANETENGDFFSLMSNFVSVPVTVIDTDQLSAYLASLLQSLLETESIKQLRYRLNFVVIGDCHNFKSVLNIVLLFSHVREDVTVTVFLKLKPTISLHEHNLDYKADTLDRSLGLGTVLRHFSKWIWFRKPETLTHLSTLNTSLDNIAVITKNLMNASEASTLLWGQTGREWSTCAPSSTDSSNTSLFPNIKLGLNGRTLKIAILQWLPFSKRHIIEGRVVYKGSSCDIIEQLSKRFNFSIEYVEPADKEWGQKTNETWTGIVGMLQRKEVDLCAVPYIFNIERSKVMTFTFPIGHTYHSAVYRKSEDESRHWKVLVSCFRWEVYLCGFVVMASIVVMLIFFRFVHEEQQSILDVFLLGISIPLHQAGLVPSRSSSSFKVLLSFWWLFCIIITSVYTGNLIAQLSVSREYVPFRTLAELGDQEDFAVSVATGTYIELLLKMTKSSELKKIWNKVDHFSGENDEFHYHTQRLLKERYVLLLDEASLDLLLSENCDLTKLPTRFLPVHASLTFQKLSPLAVLFRRELMALTENGLISKWYKHWSPQKKRCPVRSGKFQLQLRDFTSALVGILIGTGSSCFVLLVEYFMSNKRLPSS